MPAAQSWGRGVYTQSLIHEVHKSHETARVVARDGTDIFHIKDHQRHGPRKLARRRTRPYDVEIDNADRRPDQTQYNKNFRKENK